MRWGGYSIYLEDDGKKRVGWSHTHVEWRLACVSRPLSHHQCVVYTGLDGWVSDTLCLLSISHCGLAEDEIHQLLDMLGYRGHYKVATLHWAAFRSATRPWVQEKPSGLLYFRHQSLRSAVEKKLLGKARICADSCWLRGGESRIQGKVIAGIS